ncbi:MAG TPA: hypothetical protein DCG69_10315 [Bacteroidales bacterium]|nr:hypothetical protein [Bacteroidales bacterium]
MTRPFLKSLLRIGLLTCLLIFIPKYIHYPDIEFINSHLKTDLFEGKSNMPDGHKVFIQGLIPVIQEANREVLNEREHLIKIMESLRLGEKVPLQEKKWLNDLDTKYRDKSNFVDLKKDTETILSNLNELLKRVDVVPVRIALAQAAIESGWGKSRFSTEGNAYFGILCYKPGCGINSKKNENGGFIVKSYVSTTESVVDYLLFVNSKKGMQGFRNARFKFLHEDSLPNIFKLSRSIKGYSEIGDTYNQMIESMLNYYIPDNIPNN